MPSEVYEKLFGVATEQYGYVTTDDARDLEVDPHRLVVLASRGDLDRVAHGLYRFGAIPSTTRDQLMEATLWPRRLGTISHDTALDLWDLCDINPAKVHVSVPKSAKLRRTVPAAYRVHVRDLDPNDVANHEGIPVVTVHRAILDCIDADVGPHLIQQAIDTATARGLLSKSGLADVTYQQASRRSRTVA